MARTTREDRERGSMQEDRERGSTRDDRERGSMHVMTIPVAVGMLTAAVLVISMVGSATSDRREAGTAADAAALAATQEWNERLGLLHGLHLGVSEPAAFWALAEEALLTEDLEADMRAAAEAYAEENGAELVRLVPDSRQLRVTAIVRHDATVPGTTFRSEAEATAGVRLSGGLCVADGGLGWEIDGECRTEPEPEEDGGDPGEGGVDDGDAGEGGVGEGEPGEGGAGGDEPDGEEPGDDEDVEEEPAWTPPEVGGYSSSVVLVE